MTPVLTDMGNKFCNGPLLLPLQTLDLILEAHPLLLNTTPPVHLFCNSKVGTASEAKQAAWYTVRWLRDLCYHKDTYAELDQ
jgi:hypothetical protein